MSIELVSVREAAERTGQSEKKIRALISSGKLRVTRIGYHILIRQRELRKMRAATREN